MIPQKEKEKNLVIRGDLSLSYPTIRDSHGVQLQSWLVAGNLRKFLAGIRTSPAAAGSRANSQTSRYPGCTGKL